MSAGSSVKSARRRGRCRASRKKHHVRTKTSAWERFVGDCSSHQSAVGRLVTGVLSERSSSSDLKKKARIKTEGELRGLVDPDPVVSAIDDIGSYSGPTTSQDYRGGSHDLRPSLQPALSCGEYRYPLREPLSREVFRSISRRLLQTEEQSLELVQRAIHSSFQRILRTPPHEMTAEDRDLWAFLLLIVDLEAYRVANPISMTAVGTLVRADLEDVVVHWVGGAEERFDFVTCHPAISCASVGDTVHARLRRFDTGRVEWIECAISPPMGSDEEAWRQQADRIGSIDDLPEGEWPRRSDEK